MRQKFLTAAMYHTDTSLNGPNSVVPILLSHQQVVTINNRVSFGASARVWTQNLTDTPALTLTLT